MATTELNIQKPALINGLLIGLSLASGAWGIQVFTLATTPVPLQYPSLILGSMLLIGLGGVTGWLTGRLSKPSMVAVVWMITAVITTQIINFQPFYGRTLTVWLADRRFWGLPIYPYPFDFTIAQLFTGFFIILLLVVLGLFQNFRLETIQAEVGENGRLTLRAWAFLLSLMPFVIWAGGITQNIVGEPSVTAVQVVDKAIQRSRSYDGDLFELGLREDINYSALNGVQEQLNGNYTLKVGYLDPSTSTTIIVAHFKSGAWINCRVINDQLSFCNDAAPPYTIGLNSLINDTPVAENCRNCVPEATVEWQTWLQSRREVFGKFPEIERLAQWGSYVLMAIQSEDGRFAADCWFEGNRPIQLISCEENG